MRVEPDGGVRDGEASGGVYRVERLLAFGYQLLVVLDHQVFVGEHGSAAVLCFQAGIHHGAGRRGRVVERLHELLDAVLNRLRIQLILGKGLTGLVAREAVEECEERHGAGVGLRGVGDPRRRPSRLYDVRDLLDRHIAAGEAELVHFGLPPGENDGSDRSGSYVLQPTAGVTQLSPDATGEPEDVVRDVVGIGLHQACLVDRTLVGDVAGELLLFAPGRDDLVEHCALLAAGDNVECRRRWVVLNRRRCGLERPRAASQSDQRCQCNRTGQKPANTHALPFFG